MARKRRRADVAPILSLGAAMVVAALVLPSALRPPPEQQSSSAAFSPDAPPDEDPDTIIQSLRQAASRTAGASGNREGTGPGSTTTTVLAPSRGRCFGNPPRQTESAYSPPCRAAFTGDNGGSTHKNVSGDEVRVAFWHLLGMPARRGPIAASAQPGEDAPYRTARVIQQYFNERYELYGRRLQLIAIPEDPPDEAAERSSAVATEQAGAFAAVHLFYPFCDELARRDLVCFNGNPYPSKAYEQNAPKFWSYQEDTDDTDRFAAEYACKKLIGRNAEFAGEGTLGKPRKLGIIVESNSQNMFRSSRHIDEQLQAQCGVKAAVAVDFERNEDAQVAAAIAQMRQQDVTTIILEASLGPALISMATANSSQYFPEWAMFNSYGLDFNDSARNLPATQRIHVFGASGWELPRPITDTDCYRAYKTVDPAGTPDTNFCNLLYISIEHIVNGIQEAGPDLNPDTFSKGMASMPLREQRHPWAITGGYGPNDYSFVDSFVEIWWDPNAIDPNGGELGAFRYTQGGKRIRLGELDDVTRIFNEGVRGYNAP